MQIRTLISVKSSFPAHFKRNNFKGLTAIFKLDHTKKFSHLNAKLSFDIFRAQIINDFDKTNEK